LVLFSTFLTRSILTVVRCWNNEREVPEVVERWYYAGVSSALRFVRKANGSASPLNSQRWKYSLDILVSQKNNECVPWEVEYTDEFNRWWETLSLDQQKDIAHSVGLLAELGPRLGFPHSSGVKSSRHAQMRELRTQSAGRPLRTLYAFDPLRIAILLIGGSKTSDHRWYETFVPIADQLYEEHLEEIQREGKP
jgi:hypothetical protein